MPNSKHEVGVAHGRSKIKQDDSIMETNNSCIVSKRSVEKFYHKDDLGFTRFFVKKLQRRAPLINRGYWLRMTAIEHTIRMFLQSSPSLPKAVINLGCGFDSIPFKFLSEDSSICKDAIFVDVDYPKLMKKKCEVIENTDKLRNLLKDPVFKPDESGAPLQSQQYIAISCDLTDTHKLNELLRSDLKVDNRALLFVAEVSLTYMEPAAVQSTIKLAASFHHSQFCLLEQHLPDGAGNPFASTMLQHFEKLQSPLRSINQYPTMEDQRRRFEEQGWFSATVRSLWNIWNDDSWVAPEQRKHLDQIEPFDEWEDFALFSSHYSILHAYSERSYLQLEEQKSIIGISSTPPEKELEISEVDWQCSVARRGEMSRKQGAVFVTVEGQVIHHGGHSKQGRAGDYDIFGLDADIEAKADTQTPTSPLILLPETQITCHSITKIPSAQEHFLSGGRTSPEQPSSCCYVLSPKAAPRKTQSLPKGCFRHCAIPLSWQRSGLTTGVLVFGGKTSSTSLSDEFYFWNRQSDSWVTATVIGDRPTARFGAAMTIHIDNTSSGFVTGGIGNQGIVLTDLWHWAAYIEGGIFYVSCKDITGDLRSANLADLKMNVFGRFGASLITASDSYFLIGGISADGVLSHREEIFEIAPDLRLKRVNPDPYLPRPLLVGFGSSVVETNKVILVGGGATCFSFGSFWNVNTYTIDISRTAQKESRGFQFLERAKSKYNPISTRLSFVPMSTATQKTLANGSTVPQKICRVKVKSQDQFQQIVREGVPVIMEQLDLGDCTKFWSLPYLKQSVGEHREVVVHDSSSSKMNFLDKNFSYSTKFFGDFLDAIEKGERLYMRAISSEKPAYQATMLSQDFPSIASDFNLPPELQFVQNNLHSTPLRISGPVSMWLHYDVMANVLCQITGEKQVTLYKPSDVVFLAFPPGASSSRLDVEKLPDDVADKIHAHVADLKTGDVLFIPPLWPHSATPEGVFSVAINAFFRDLVGGGYAAGKDVYGNRDLQAYENGRKDIARMVKTFRGLPAESRRFYLSRLAEELTSLATHD